MAIHSDILSWEIPWTKEPGGLQPMGLQGSEMTEHTRMHTRTVFRSDCTSLHSHPQLYRGSLFSKPSLTFAVSNSLLTGMR